MPVYRRSQTFDAGEDRVFEYLAAVENLPKYFDKMTEAKPIGDDRVDVAAEVDGHTEHGKAWFRVDRTARRIQWGAEDHPYAGMLDLTADQNRTIVDIELHTDHDSSEVERSIEATFDHIRHQVETTG